MRFDWKAADMSEPKATSNRLAEVLATGSQEFFASPSLKELANSQGVNPLKCPSELAGGWPPEEDVDEFLDLTRRTRR